MKKLFVLAIAVVVVALSASSLQALQQQFRPRVFPTNPSYQLPAPQPVASADAVDPGQQARIQLIRIEALEKKVQELQSQIDAMQTLRTPKVVPLGR